ncbi:citrate synthase [Adlercreutzia murintestinalis]|uniref:citrate synthase n=1 Tax=Adlercreutzia murintestinalis TaxID=2941325 RepID=UPI0020410BF2|nr:citrate synthase [Adlercreutzia murintestinalis]
MPIEIDETLVADDDGRVQVGEADTIQISPDEARRVGLYHTFDDVNRIPAAAYEGTDVKRGLRNADGTGVVAGITNISQVIGYNVIDGVKVPAEGSLRLRGYELSDLLGTAGAERRFAFEELCYLLLMGDLPTQHALDEFIGVIDTQRELPDGFTASTLMNAASHNIMNVLAQSILKLYAYDDHAEERTAKHEIHTALSLLSRLPRIMVLSYYSKRARFNHESMIMHRFVEGQSTAETILSMLRPDRAFTPDEARMLDIMLCIHAEHGGGNNSTFATRVLTSADTDPYSAYAAAIGALKGYRHGGANHKVRAMQDEIKRQVSDWSDEGQVADYLRRIVAKEAYDRTGLVYGMGHAVYTLSDPRANILKGFAERLAKGTEFEAEFDLLRTIERIAPQVVAEGRGISKTLCANVDMYSGFVYSMMGIPEDLYTPLFACGRMAGWAAHRFEEIVSGKRIIRPAYNSLRAAPRIYQCIDERK